MLNLVRRKNIINDVLEELSGLLRNTSEAIKALENPWLSFSDDGKQYQKVVREYLNIIFSQITMLKYEIPLVTEKSYFDFISSIQSKQRMAAEKIKIAKENMEKELINNKLYVKSKEEHISLNEPEKIIFDAIREKEFEESVKFDKLICGYYVLVH